MKALFVVLFFCVASIGRAEVLLSYQPAFYSGTVSVDNRTTGTAVIEFQSSQIAEVASGALVDVSIELRAPGEVSATVNGDTWVVSVWPYTEADVPLTPEMKLVATAVEIVPASELIAATRQAFDARPEAQGTFVGSLLTAAFVAHAERSQTGEGFVRQALADVRDGRADVLGSQDYIPLSLRAAFLDDLYTAAQAVMAGRIIQLEATVAAAPPDLPGELLAGFE